MLESSHIIFTCYDVFRGFGVYAHSSERNASDKRFTSSSPQESYKEFSLDTIYFQMIG
jgi:hypothetical protein